MSEPDSSQTGRPIGSAQLRIAAARSASQSDWSGLTDVTSEAAYTSTWLALQCARIPNATAGLLALRSHDTDKLSVAALWPNRDIDLPNLSRLVELAFTERRIAVSRDRTSSADTPAAAGNLLIAAPLGVSEIVGVAAISVTNRPGTRSLAPETIAEQLRWGAGWLEAVPLARRAEGNSDGLALASACTDLMIACGEQHQLHGMAIAIVNELATRLNCDRVSLGTLKRNGAVRLRAISHSARFRNEGRLIDAIENAMEEAVDQKATVACPALPATERRVAMAHKELAGLVKASAPQLMSVVLPDGRGGTVGAITLERHQSETFEDETLRLVEAMSALVGPMVYRQLRANRLLAGRIVDLAGNGFTAVLGAGRPSLKIGAICLAALLLYLPFASGQHNVTAKAVLEPELQRAAVVPFDGYIEAAPVRAGDTVRQGDVLARLDDRDLVLEQLKQKAARDKLVKGQRRWRLRLRRLNQIGAPLPGIRWSLGSLGLSGMGVAFAGQLRHQVWIDVWTTTGEEQDSECS